MREERVRVPGRPAPTPEDEARDVRRRLLQRADPRVVRDAMASQRQRDGEPGVLGDALGERHAREHLTTKDGGAPGEAHLAERRPRRLVEELEHRVREQRVPRLREPVGAERELATLHAGGPMALERRERRAEPAAHGPVVGVEHRDEVALEALDREVELLVLGAVPRRDDAHLPLGRVEQPLHAPVGLLAPALEHRAQGGDRHILEVLDEHADRDAARVVLREQRAHGVDERRALVMRWDEREHAAPRARLRLDGLPATPALRQREAVQTDPIHAEIREQREAQREQRGGERHQGVATAVLRRRAARVAQGTTRQESSPWQLEVGATQSSGSALPSRSGSPQEPEVP